VTRWLLDTDTCIYLIKRDPPQVLQRLEQCDPGDVWVSSITVSEMEYGIAKSSRPEQARNALEKFLASLGTLPYDDTAATAYGIIRADLERRGEPIGPLDMLIAGHALSLGATLVTNNEREFRRVPSLAIENWATA